jgi:hypothetical protein
MGSSSIEVICILILPKGKEKHHMSACFFHSLTDVREKILLSLLRMISFSHEYGQVFFLFHLLFSCFVLIITTTIIQFDLASHVLDIRKNYTGHLNMNKDKINELKVIELCGGFLSSTLSIDKTNEFYFYLTQLFNSHLNNVFIG